MRVSVEPNTFPASYDPDDTHLVALPVALLPHLSGLIALWEEQDAWESAADWVQGREAAYLLQERIGT